MNEHITFSARASLMVVGRRMQQMGVWQTVREHVHIPQKVISHQPLDKLLDAFINIVAGGHGLYEINTRVRSDRALQAAFGRRSCAEQSVVSDTLNACTSETVEQLREEVKQVYQEYGQGYRHDYHRTVSKGHGHIETRECWALSDPDILSYSNAYRIWPGLQSLVEVTSTRLEHGQSAQGTRYFISSLPSNATQLLTAVRTHWQIEDRLHWVLDMAFREDAKRSRKDHAAQNLAILHPIALTLLKLESSLKVGLKAKRLRASWDERYLLKVLAKA